MSSKWAGTHVSGVALWGLGLAWKPGKRVDIWPYTLWLPRANAACMHACAQTRKYTTFKTHGLVCGCKTVKKGRRAAVGKQVGSIVVVQRGKSPCRIPSPCCPSTTHTSQIIAASHQSPHSSRFNFMRNIWLTWITLFLIKWVLGESIHNKHFGY